MGQKEPQPKPDELELDYEKLTKELENLPLTWYPAIFIKVLELVIEKKVFNGRWGLLNVIHKVINKKEGG